MRGRAKMLVGDPIDMAPYETRERDSQLVRELLVKCVKEIAKLAGHDDFEPEVAGRKWRERTADTPSEEAS